MEDIVNKPIHIFPGQAYSLAVTRTESTYMYFQVSPITYNCLSLNQRKGENGHRNYFVGTFYESYVAGLRLELLTLEYDR